MSGDLDFTGADGFFGGVHGNRRSRRERVCIAAGRQPAGRPDQDGPIPHIRAENVPAVNFPAKDSRVVDHAAEIRQAVDLGSKNLPGVDLPAFDLRTANCRAGDRDTGRWSGIAMPEGA